MEIAPTTQHSEYGGPARSRRRERTPKADFRFALVDLLPTALLLTFLLGLLASGAPNTAPDLHRLSAAVGRLRFVHAAIFAGIVLFIALVSHPFQISIIRLLEGYWDVSPIGRWLSTVGTAIHRRRRARLEALAYQRPTGSYQWKRRRATVQLQGYPSEARLLPTMLGNALRAAEDEAGPRYGLLTMATMPRLYPCLPDRFAATLSDLRNQLDIAARFCVSFLIATVISTILLLRHGGWLAVSLVTMVLAWVSYRAAVRAAMQYGEGLRVAFDLYRFDLLRTLHLPLPVDHDEEQALNRRLSAYFAAGIPMRSEYRHASDEPLDA